MMLQELMDLTDEAETGIDLIHETVKEMASLMNLNERMKKMDSLMVASNIRKLGRIELLYTCVADFVTFLHRMGMDELLTGMEHYYDSNDYNRVIYHSRSEGACDENFEYQLLVRILKKQATVDGKPVADG